MSLSALPLSLGAALSAVPPVGSAPGVVVVSLSPQAARAKTMTSASISARSFFIFI